MNARKCFNDTKKPSVRRLILVTNEHVFHQEQTTMQEITPNARARLTLAKFIRLVRLTTYEHVKDLTERDKISTKF